VTVPLPEPDQQLEIIIETLAPNGKGKGRATAPGWEKLAFFVEGAAPGDRVLVKVTGGRKRYVEADLLEVLHPSEMRVEPVCPVFVSCGGCQIMHLDYPHQLAAKQDMLRYIFRRRGFDPELIAPPQASPQQTRYRPRAVISLTADGRPGMQMRRSHEVVPISSCHLMHAELEAGMLSATRNLSPDDFPGMKRLQGVRDPATGTIYLQAFGEGRFLSDWFVMEGDRPRMIEHPLCRLKVGEDELEYSPDCFTQVNEGINQLLVAHVLDSLTLEASDRVLELYAGIGNFTLTLARRAGKVTAVELPPTSDYTQRNVQQAGLTTIDVRGMEVRSALRRMVKRKETVDKVLLDPPREGLGKAGCRDLSALSPSRIVYVSCDPLSLVADLEELKKKGYCLTSLTPFDMFPQTFHVESCAVMEMDAP